MIDRLSYDLRQAFPDMSGLAARNLKHMRAFASALTERAITQAPLAQLTWYPHLAFERLDDKAVRLWYATWTVEHGWSRNLLAAPDRRPAPCAARKGAHQLQANAAGADSDFAAYVFKPPPVVT